MTASKKKFLYIYFTASSFSATNFKHGELRKKYWVVRISNYWGQNQMTTLLPLLHLINAFCQSFTGPMMTSVFSCQPRKRFILYIARGAKDKRFRRSWEAPWHKISNVINLTKRRFMDSCLNFKHHLARRALQPEFHIWIFNAPSSTLPVCCWNILWALLRCVCCGKVVSWQMAGCPFLDKTLHFAA